MADKQKNNKSDTTAQQTKKMRMRQRLQTLLYLGIIFASVALLVLFAIFVLEPAMLYHSANKFAEEGNYSQALQIYTDLDGYLGSEKKIAEIQQNLFEIAVEEENYEQAVIAAESGGELQKYIEERPEIFYLYGKSKVESNPTVAKTYLEYVPDYPGVKEVYDEACLRSALKLMEMNRYADALIAFDTASSLDWFATLSPAEAYSYAEKIAAYSYERAMPVLALHKEKSPACAERYEQIKNYTPYIGEKTCISDTANQESVNTVNYFDFFFMDGTEYLIVRNDTLSAVIDASNYAFAKDTDGSYFALSTDTQTQLQYLYRFFMLENGSIQEKLIVTHPDGTEQEMIRTWN